MSTDTVSAFRSSLAGRGVSCSRVAAAEFDDVLAETIERPAVGAPLGIDGVSLEGTHVTTNPTPGQLREARTGVTRAAKGIAEYGTLLLQPDAGGTEPASLYPPTHVAVLRASDVVPDLEAGLDWLDGEFAAGRDSAVLATGPSSTADMGGLVRGAHGPEQVHVVLLTDR